VLRSDARTLSMCLKSGGANEGAAYENGSRAGCGALVIMALLGAFLCLSYVVLILDRAVAVATRAAAPCIIHVGFFSWPPCGSIVRTKC